MTESQQKSYLAGVIDHSSYISPRYSRSAYRIEISSRSPTQIGMFTSIFKGNPTRKNSRLYLEYSINTLQNLLKYLDGFLQYPSAWWSNVSYYPSGLNDSFDILFYIAGTIDARGSFCFTNKIPVLRYPWLIELERELWDKWGVESNDRYSVVSGKWALTIYAYLRQFLYEKTFDSLPLFSSELKNQFLHPRRPDLIISEKKEKIIESNNKILEIKAKKREIREAKKQVQIQKAKAYKQWITDAPIRRAERMAAHKEIIHQRALKRAELLALQASATEKTCKICHAIKPVNEFIKCQKCAGGRGHICLTCARERYRIDPKIACEKSRAWQRANPDKVREISRRRNAKPQQKIRRMLRNRLLDYLDSKIEKSSELFGCTPKQLVAHLESQFQSGMTWETYGLNGWHIDHIIPCRAFNLTQLEERKRCFHYTNLRPLWGSENSSKADTLPDGRKARDVYPSHPVLKN